jgi:hypothetical protein
VQAERPRQLPLAEVRRQSGSCPVAGDIRVRF